MNEDVIIIAIKGLDSLDDFEKLPANITKSARIAVNSAATRGRTAMAKEVLHQINLPSDYVSPRNKRLYVKEKATGATLEAVIEARSRPTSLARFAQNASTKRGSGVRVEVDPGVVRTLPNEKYVRQGYSAWLMPLKSGSSKTDTKSNLGLAMRVPAGKRPPGAFKPKSIGNNIYLLYGPSVSQILYGVTTGNGVATDLAPDIQQMLSDEFMRQMER